MLTVHFSTAHIEMASPKTHQRRDIDHNRVFGELSLSFLIEYYTGIIVIIHTRHPHIDDLTSNTYACFQRHAGSGREHSYCGGR